MSWVNNQMERVDRYKKMRDHRQDRRHQDETFSTNDNTKIQFDSGRGSRSSSRPFKRGKPKPPGYWEEYWGERLSDEENEELQSKINDRRQ
jgi:hypothetical protein